MISYRLDEFAKPPGDYFFLRVSPSNKPQRILSNKRTSADSLALRGHFFGPPLWSPNDRYLLIMRLVGMREYQQPYILELKTGKIEGLPIGSMGDMRSWGGRP
jgi:hypothetical protein